jgi:hypothetical protein
MIRLGYQVLRNKIHPLLQRCQPCHPLPANAFDGMGRRYRPQEGPLSC